MTGLRSALLVLLSLLIMFLPLTQAYAAGATVGVIMTGDIQYYRDIHKALMDEMKGAGAEFVVQTPMPEPVSWANAANKLVVVGASVIVSYGAPATLTTMKATTDIPIIFAGVYTPDAMNVTGKNATGASSTVSIEELLKNMKKISNFSSLGVIFNKSEKDTILQARDIKNFEKSLGFNTVLFSVANKVDKSIIKNVDALLLTASCSGMQCIHDIVGVARQGKMMTASTIGGGEDMGVILTLAANPEEQGKEAARMVKQVLKGSAVSSIPVAEPRKVDFIVNLKEANAIGLSVPQDVLNAATKVIR